MASSLLSSSSSVALKQETVVLSRHGSSPIVSFRRNYPVVWSPLLQKDEEDIRVKPEASFLDLFAFSGQIPEAVNGRLAMLGFTTALGVELASGRDLFGQIDNGGTSYFVGTALLFTLASLAPLIQGVSIERASGGIGGIFTSRAERWNGRAAMLGLVALAITEVVKGSPLV